MWDRLLQILDYWGYFFQSTDLHGIHSPFIYQLSEFSFFNKEEKRIQFIEIQRTEMLKSNGKIENYSISKFANHYSLDAKYAFAIYRISHFLDIHRYHEYGLCTGIETNYMLHRQLAILKRQISYTYHFKENPVKKHTNETWFKSEVNSDLHELSTMPSSWEMHLIHQHEHADKIWDYAEDIVTNHHKHTLLIITNIHETDDHTLNWKRLQNDDRTGVSIDLFKMGIIFFRKEQSKEHFTLRY